MNSFMINQALGRISAQESLSEHTRQKRDFTVYVDTSLSDRYFNTAFRYGEGIIGVESDLCLLNDPQTPDVLKQYIQQHSAKVTSHVSSPYGEQDLDDLIPSNLQTYGEVKQFIDDNNLNII